MSVSSGTLKVGIAAVVVGLIGAYGVRTYLQNNKEPEAPPPEPPRTITVPVANTELPEDRMIAQGDIAFIPMTVELFRETGWAADEVMLSGDQVIGRMLKKTLKKGDPFLTTELYLAGDGPNISKLLKPGERAVRLQVSFLDGGDVDPGTFVDIMLQVHPQGSGRYAIPEMTKTLLGSIRVIDVFRPSINWKAAVVGYVAKDPIVTVAVSPEQAMRLRAIQGKGEISLIPVPEQEYVSTHLAVSDNSMTFAEAIDYEFPPEPPAPPAPQPVPEPEMYRTVIYKGGVPQVMAFPKSTTLPATYSRNSRPAAAPLENPRDYLPVMPSGDETRPSEADKETPASLEIKVNASAADESVKTSAGP